MAAVLATLAHSPPGVAEGSLDAFPDIPPERTLTFVLENDVFTGDDSGYTNGIALIVSRGPYDRFDARSTPGWIVPLVDDLWIARGERQRAHVWNVVQTMQTPEDITIEALQEDDLPYAGLLLAGINLYAFDPHKTDQLGASLGIVGPASLAEESQTVLHDVIGADEPQGWDNQLDNEPVFELTASRGWRLTDGMLGERWEADLIASTSGAVGNLSSYGAVTLVARVGRQLLTTWPTASLLPNRQPSAAVFAGRGSWYAFAGAESAYIANDIFIDGNTFEDSHSLPLDHWRERLAAGASYAFDDWAFSLVYADVPGNADDDAFGALNITWKY